MENQTPLMYWKARAVDLRNLYEQCPCRDFACALRDAQGRVALLELTCWMGNALKNQKRRTNNEL